MSLYLAAYDIASDARRRRVSRVLESYGVRVQESVFELCVGPDDLARLRVRVGVLLSRDDRFGLWPIEERGARRRTNWSRRPVSWGPVIDLWADDPDEGW